MSAVALIPSRHALEVMQSRDVTWGEVVSAVTHAEVSDVHQGRTRYYRGELCVVVADSTVVTVLLRSRERWEDKHARNRNRG